MTVLSVFSRRRMYGRTSSRSGAVRVVRPLRQALGEARELLAGAEQAGIDEVEDGPEVPEPILDGGAGERDPRLRVELLDRARLLGAGILDGLRLVEHGQAPRDLRQPGRAQERAVAGDDEVDVREAVRESSASSSAAVIADGCATSGSQARCEALDLRHPVGQERRRRDEQADRLSPSRCVLRASSSDRTCIVLPSPMSSARHAPRPSRERRWSQRTPTCW